jgi:serine palmitoyltransferase
MVSAVVALLGFMVPSVRLFTLNSHKVRRDERVRFADVHLDLERDIADFLGTEASILYSQGFSTIPCVISAFSKRGDIVVADRGINFAIQKGLQISRSTVRWFEHNDLRSLEGVLLSVEKERRKRRGPLTRRFIVTEGIFEKDGAMVDLPKLVSCSHDTKRMLAA